MELPNARPPLIASAEASPASWGLRRVDVWLFQWMDAGRGARRQRLAFAKAMARWG